MLNDFERLMKDSYTIVEG